MYVYSSTCPSPPNSEFGSTILFVLDNTQQVSFSMLNFHFAWEKCVLVHIGRIIVAHANNVSDLCLLHKDETVVGYH